MCIRTVGVQSTSLSCSQYGDSRDAVVIKRRWEFNLLGIIASISGSNAASADTISCLYCSCPLRGVMFKPLT